MGSRPFVDKTIAENHGTVVDELGALKAAQFAKPAMGGDQFGFGHILTRT